jgi:hypothetical protein
MYLRGSAARGQVARCYTREDDPLGQALLGEGQALGELFRRPCVHRALPHQTRRLPSSLRHSAMLLGGVCGR